MLLITAAQYECDLPLKHIHLKDFLYAAIFLLQPYLFYQFLQALRQYPVTQKIQDLLRYGLLTVYRHRLVLPGYFFHQ